MFGRQIISRRETLYCLGALGAGAILPRNLTGAAQPVPTGPLTPATVTISATAIGAIGSAFAGLSYEKDQMANPLFSPQKANASGLFKLIGPSLLRIGGNSVDKTTWTANGAGPSLDATTGVTIQGASIQPNGAFTPGAPATLETNGSTVSCYVGLLTAVLVQIPAPSTPPLTIVSSASLSGVVAPGSFASAYGNSLAASVSLTDSSGVSTLLRRELVSKFSRPSVSAPPE
jgi:hypothetical protein